MDKTIVKGRLLDIMIITECAKALSWEQVQTRGELIGINIRWGSPPEIHLTREGLAQMEPNAAKWRWETDREFSRNGSPRLLPNKATCSPDEVIFFALFTDEEMEDARIDKL